VGVEVGVFTGTMSQVLLNRNRTLHLFLVDNWLPAEEQPAAYRETEDYHSKLSAGRQRNYRAQTIRNTRRYGERCTILECSSVEAAAQFPDGQCDFVFLDADHSYEGTLADIEAWWPKIRPGCWLCGHDYGGWAVIRPSMRKKHYGVKRAADEAAERLGVVVVPDDDYTFFMTKPDG
jgi:hypothetical protein